MRAAIEEAGFPDDVRPALIQYFERTATFMINAGSERLDLRG